jgi:hypothetical protein
MSIKSNKGTIVIERRMHRSPAFRKLSTNSIFVLFEFLSRRKMVQDGRKGRWGIANNGEIIFTYAEAQKKFGMFRSTFCRSIDQLVHLGFIEISHQGGGLLKDYSKYAISERWRDYGKEEFIKQSRRRDTRGLGFTKENWKKTAGKNKSKSKIGTNNATSSSITNDTYDHQTPITPSIIHATHQIDPNHLILKGLDVLKAMHSSQYH